MSCTEIKDTRGCDSKACKEVSKLDYTSLEELVTAYVEHCKPAHDAELELFSEAEDLRRAIGKAVRSKLWDGKMAPHQRRIGVKKLEAAVPFFEQKEAEIEVAENFKQLHRYASEICKSCKGLGELAAYDIALRISSYKQVLPKDIFLHAGVSKGAKNLGFSETEFISRDRFVKKYPEFESLKAYEIENLLCIFKDKLAVFKHLTPPK